MKQNCSSFSGWQIRCSVKILEDLCCRAWGIRRGLRPEIIRMGRGGASVDAVLVQQNGQRRGTAQDTLSSIHWVPVVQSSCVLLGLVGGCLKNRKVSPSFSRHFCSSRRNKTLTSEVSSVGIDWEPTWVRKELCLRSNLRVTAKWQIRVNRMKQDRTILCMLLGDAKPQGTRSALVRKGFQDEVTVGSQM